MLNASASARPAIPTAAAPTLQRSASNVARAIPSPCPVFTKELCPGDAAALEGHGADGVRRDQLEALRDGHARSRRIHQESTEAVAPTGRTGAAEHHVEMGQPALEMRLLTPSSHIGSAPFAAPRSLTAAGSDPGVRLGQGKRSMSWPEAKPRQIAALLFRRPGRCQGVGGKRLPPRTGLSARGDTPGQGLADDAQVPDLDAAASPPNPRGTA